MATTSLPHQTQAPASNSQLAAILHNVVSSTFFLLSCIFKLSPIYAFSTTQLNTHYLQHHYCEYSFNFDPGWRGNSKQITACPMSNLGIHFHHNPSVKCCILLVAERLTSHYTKNVTNKQINKTVLNSTFCHYQNEANYFT